MQLITSRNTSYCSLLCKLMKSYCIRKEENKKKVYNLINLYSASCKRTSSLFYCAFNIFIARYKQKEVELDGRMLREEMHPTNAATSN